ncbi:MAG: hypothetical protein ABJ327_17880 [Litoreibacter sp.]
MSNSNTRIEEKINALTQAQNQHLSALAIYGRMEKRGGIGNLEAEAFNTSNCDPALEAVRAAESALARTPACTLAQFAVKVAALLDNCIQTEVAEILAYEAKALTSISDPVVEVFAQWKRLRAIWLKMAHACPTGNWDMPAHEEIQTKMDDLERKITNTTATTPEGLAAQAEWLWMDQDMIGREGTEPWIERMGLPDIQCMAALRNGAALAAGLNSGM